MFDVFYSGKKPNLFAFEKPARDLDDAAAQCRTGYYWYIYGDRDYSTFDFTWRPAPWENEYVHVWPTQHHQHGGAYFANAQTVSRREYKFYDQVVTATANDNWEILAPVAEFDWSWHPHPLDPAYTYVFGNQWHAAQRMPTVRYNAGSAEIKYINTIRATLAPTIELWQVKADTPIKFDFSWCPDPFDPPFIYVFGNQYWEGQRSATVEYHVPGATERKFVENVLAELDDLQIFYIDKNNPLAGKIGRAHV